MILGRELGRLSLGQLGTGRSISLGFGSFVLTGEPISFTRQITSTPLRVVRDYWDMDEWGRFIPGGGMRYTL